MKRKLQFLTKTLLVAVLLGVGVNGAWAVDITETYNFAAFITANGTANLTTSGDGIAQSGTSAKVGTVKVIDNLTANAQTLDLKGRFAVDYQYNANVNIRFMWRSSTNNYQHGLAGNWNGNGTADAQGAARFSVLNLKAGDKITFTYYKNNVAADPYTCSASQLTGVNVDVALASGTKYTVAADGNVDLYFTNNNFAIASIVIETTGTETVGAPTFEITGAYNKTRKVTITAGTSDAGNDVTTYYTTDGSTPTTSSPNSFTTSSQEITVGESAESESTVTVKAISVSTSTAASDVASEDVTVGTIIKLAQPSITLTGMGLDNGKYYKQYTFAAVSTGTYGTPSISVAGTLGGNNITNPYTASTAGTISVVASADGYANSDAATLDVDGAAFLLARSYDFTQDSYREGLSTEGNNITITGAGVQVYRIPTEKVNMIAGLTLSNSNFGFTKAQNSDTRKGLAPRWGAGSITINNWIDGSFATLIDLVGNGVYSTSSNGTFSFAAQVNTNTFTALNIYTPENSTVSATLGTNGYTTFASSYPLDLTTANLPDGVTAYKAAVSGNVVNFTPLNQTVLANTGILLKGTASETVNIPVVASGTAVTENAFLVNTTGATITSDETTFYFAMVKDSDPLTFGKITSVAIPANKAYLSAPATNFAGAPALTAIFEDGSETTGINTVQGSEFTVNGEYYNLAGQRVAQPTKGLYIVNGKKVVVK